MMAKKKTASSKESTTLEVAQATTATVLATFDPPNATNRNVTWSSDADEYATVTETDNPATIAAVAAGSATVTCTTEDGSHTDTVAVTVTDP